MERLNDYRMRMVLIGVVAAIMLGGVSAKADFTFGEATNLGPPLSSPHHDESPCMTADGLEFYLSRSSFIYVATRATTDDDWSTPVNLGYKINVGVENFAPCVSLDGLKLYFTSTVTHSYSSNDLWVATREEVHNEWGTPKNVGHPVNSTSWGERCPVISADELELYFSSYMRSGGYGNWDVWVASRQTTDDDWGTPINLGSSINSSAWESPGSISADGLILFLHSDRNGGNGGYDIWMTRRATRNDPWEEPINVGPNVNSPQIDAFPTVSFDGHWLYFSDFVPYIIPDYQPRPGGFGMGDIWKAPIIPIVDLNGDGIVNAADMVIMVDHWGTDNSLCDIGPMPWGDGTVDVQDLVVLAEHLFEEFPAVEPVI